MKNAVTTDVEVVIACAVLSRFNLNRTRKFSAKNSTLLLQSASDAHRWLVLRVSRLLRVVRSLPQFLKFLKLSLEFLRSSLDLLTLVLSPVLAGSYRVVVLAASASSKRQLFLACLLTFS